MGKHVHRMLDKDIENMRGVCAACGPVALKQKRKDGWYCENAVREYQDKAVKLRRAGRDYMGHGLTHAEAQAFRAGKCCEICGAPEVTGSRGHAVDHNHATGQLRGVLCARCNVRLASVEDGQWLMSALSYLARYM